MVFLVLVSGCSKTQLAYSNKIDFDDVKTYQDKTIISGTIYKSSVTQNSKSMYPTIPVTSTILYTKDFSYSNLYVGDIIRFKVDYACDKTMVEATKEYGSETTLHRIVGKKQDTDGIYYKTKGDNQFFKDSCKVRLNDIEAVVVGVIY